jgi:hypothetical protein
MISITTNALKGSQVIPPMKCPMVCTAMDVPKE